MHRNTSLIRWATAAVVALAVTACSSASKPEVASLTNPAVTNPQVTSTSVPSATTVFGGSAPRERLDMTDDDLAALYQPYNQCLADNGVTSHDPTEAKQQEDVVTQTCQPLYPLPPWEYDPNNPDARDFVDAVIDCLRHNGVEYVEAENDPTATRINIAFGGPDNDRDSITKGLELLPTCQTEASKTS